jgi:hypothetical protein
MKSGVEVVRASLHWNCIISMGIGSEILKCSVVREERFTPDGTMENTHPLISSLLISTFLLYSLLLFLLYFLSSSA